MKEYKTMNTKWIAMTLLTTALTWASSQVNRALGAPAVRVAAAIWAHDELYDTVATDTAFAPPPAKSTDVIFSFGGSGLEGQRSVADSAPGDPDFNGGRWTVMSVVFTPQGKLIHDADGDGTVDFELTNADAVLHHAELGHLVIEHTGVYFECPMLPREGAQR